MRRRRKLQVEEDAQLRLDISPLVDMIFLLLIFFMVTSALVRHEAMEVVPPASKAGVAVPADAVILTVDSQGKISYCGEPVPLTEVRQLVSGLMGRRALPVVVAADQDSTTGVAVRVLEQCRLAGAASVSLGTRGE